jgi:5'-AMP-activated protein kinase, regulatory gamma subunit
LALVEHGLFGSPDYFILFLETDAAPIWDPERRTFVSMMTTKDYYQIRKRRSLLGLSLQSLSISDILASDDAVHIQNEFHSIDAEDSVKELCGMLDRLDVDYISVVDPDEGNLVAVLGDMDILHLLAQLAQRHPTVFASSIESLPLVNLAPPPTISTSSLLSEVIPIMCDRNISTVPVVDNNNRVVGLYNFSDTSFITKLSSSSDISALSNIDHQTIGEILETQYGHGNQHTPTCQAKDSIKFVLEQMVALRVTKLVYIDQNAVCLGIIRARDIFNSILPEQTP